MSVELALLVTLIAWTLGPTILRCTGNLLMLLALIVWAIPIAPHTSTATGVGTALVGAVMRYTGTTWRAWRTVHGPYRLVGCRRVWLATRQRTARR
jgi:hypothetical protein